MSFSQMKTAMKANLPTREPRECKVLIVDDDERIVEAFSLLLARDGYQIISTTNAHDALSLVSSEQPDVVVLDVVMPGTDGIQLCRHIKMSHDTRFVPVILVTGLKEKKRRLEGLEAGADDFLGKPIDPLELSVRVRSLLRTKQLHDEVENHRQELEKRVDQRTYELKLANARLEELSQVKSRVLAVVAHELRTPLHQARTAFELVSQLDYNSEKRGEVVGAVKTAFTQLEQKLDDVKAFSDPTDIKLAPATVTDLLFSSQERLRRSRKLSENSVVLDLRKGLPPVSVDTALMTRAVAHIIDNAVKFSDGAPVTISARKVAGGVRVDVNDCGPGISDELLPRLFTPLQQGDSSDTRKHGGLGIGLALVKMIFDAHDIQLTIDNTADIGTTVSFTLPLARL